MSVILNFTATHRAGNFVRIFSAMSRLGLRPQNGAIKKSADATIDSIQMHLNAEQHIEPSIFNQLKEMVPTIVDIQIDPSSRATVKPSTHATSSATRVTSKRPTPAIEPTPQSPLKNTTASQASSLPQFDDDRLNFETKRLAGAYPNEINTALTYLETTMNPSQREYILTQLGIRIGMYAARKLKSAENKHGINGTVGNSLAMHKSQFGTVSPVIAGIMKRKAAQKSTSTQRRANVLVAELNKFVITTWNNNQLHIAGCPHCDSAHTSQSPDCFFIVAFIDSFIKDMWGETKQSVQQTQSKAAGWNHCVFLISGVQL